MRDITITKVMNGYIVRVACQTLVFDNEAFMLVEVARYLKDPTGVEAEYVSKFGYAIGTRDEAREVAPPTPPRDYSLELATANPTANRRVG